MYSLFIGRWQPFHKGHKALIDKVLEEGKKVVVAVRSTEVTEGNPYTVGERKKMIKEVYGRRVKVIEIPDVTEVCYGRKVGWSIRRVRLENQLEEISGTKIRDSKKGIIWLTGNTGSGKTAIATLIKERLNAILLDGDEMRNTISVGASFSKKDREEHNLRVARLAKLLNEQGFNVIVSVIAPYESTRKKINKICSPFWIYIKGGGWGTKETPYEPPKNPDLTIDPSKKSLLESMDKIIKGVTKPNGGSNPSILHAI
jgi:cytidyltransferase-like protein